jgi:ADP-ribose pyrophosphatase
VRANNLVHDGNGWKTVSSKTHFADKHLEVVTDIVRTPSQTKPRPWIVVHRKPAVVIAPMLEDGKFLLVRQERIPIRAAIWEMPAGQIDHTIEPNESDVAEAALREMREETRHDLKDGGELISLGHYFSSPGFTDEHGYFFLARPVVPCEDETAIDHEESILDCRAFSIMDLRRMIAENEIRDANTLSICARLAARGFISLEPRE